MWFGFASENKTETKNIFLSGIRLKTEFSTIDTSCQFHCKPSLWIVCVYVCVCKTKFWESYFFLVWSSGLWGQRCVFYLCVSDWAVWCWGDRRGMQARGQSASARPNPPVWATYSTRPGKKREKGWPLLSGQGCVYVPPCSCKRFSCAHACTRYLRPIIEPSTDLAYASMPFRETTHLTHVASLPCQHAGLTHR